MPENRKRKFPDLPILIPVAVITVIVLTELRDSSF